MTTNSTTIMLCGVGGQGVILAAQVIARTAIKEGYQVKVSEIHGMSQRGGSVTTVVRFSEGEVFSMLTDLCGADYILSLEQTEALRYVSYVKEEGLILSADKYQEPITVATGMIRPVEKASEKLALAGVELVSAMDIVRECGNEKCLNIIMLGALSRKLSFAKENWVETIKEMLPEKIRDLNLRAFEMGREALS